MEVSQKPMFWKLSGSVSVSSITVIELKNPISIGFDILSGSITVNTLGIWGNLKLSHF